MSDGVAGRSLLRDPFLYGAAAFALVVCGPLYRYLGSLGDEGILLHGAIRLLHGEMAHRDFFEIIPPGGFLIVAGWMKLFGADFGSVRILAVSLIALIAALSYAAAALASGHRILPILLATTWAVRAPFENNHHWLTTAASMAAAVGVFLAIEESPPRRGAVLLSGLFAGAAVTVTQTRGIFLCVAILGVFATLPWARTRLPTVMAGMIVCPTATIAYVALTGALAPAAQDLIWFTSHRYAAIQALPFGSFATRTDAVTIALFPVALLLTGVALALRPHGAIWRDPRGRTALALATAGLLGGFPRPDIGHLNFIVPLACPLVAFLVTYLAARLDRPAHVTVSVLAIGLCLVALTYATKRRMDVMTEPLDAIWTPRGVVVRRATPSNADLALLIEQIDRTPPGDPFFFYAYLPMLPYLTGRHHVAAVDVMVPGYTTPEQFRDTCARVVREARWLVVDRTWSDPSKLGYFFPAMVDQNPPEKRAFEDALARAFDDLVLRSPTFEVRRRGAAVADTLCPQPAASPGR